MKIVCFSSNRAAEIFTNADYQIIAKNNEEVLNNARNSRIQFIYLVMLIIMLLSVPDARDSGEKPQ